MNKKALVFAGAFVFSLAAAAAHQGVLLRRELKEDATETYKMQSDVKSTASVPGIGDQDLILNSTMTLTIKSGKLDSASGQVAVDAKIGDLTTKVDGSMAQFVEPMLSNIPKEFKMSGKLDGRNRVALDPAKSPDLMMTMVTGTSPSSSFAFVEFPEKSVNVGDTWKFAAPKNPLFGKEAQTLDAKLTGEKDLDGSKVWVISVTGKLKIDANIGELMKASGNQGGGLPDVDMVMKGTADVTGEALVDKTSGKTLSYTTSVAQKTSMDMGGQGSVDSNGTIKTTMTLQK